MSRERNERILERMPKPFREQYFSLFKGPEPETLHPDLYQRLIDIGTDKIIEHMKRYNQRRRELIKKVRGKIEISRLRRDEKMAEARVVASDAGNNGVDLRSAFIPLYASVALMAEGWSIPHEPIFRAGEPTIWSDEFKAGDREALLAWKIQADATIEAIQRWKPKFVFFDGPIILSFWMTPTSSSTAGYRRDFEETIGKMVSLIHICHEMDIPLIGFVKRARSGFLCKDKFGVKNMRDTALLDLVLHLGEYTEPVEMKRGLIETYKGKAAELGISKHEAEELMTFYFSYMRTGLTTPFRLEFSKYSLDRLEEAGTVLFTTSEEEEGIPFSINEADRLTKVTTNISNIRTLMLYSKALDLVKRGEMQPEDLNLLILQHGEPWTIRDEGYISSMIEEGGV